MKIINIFSSNKRKGVEPDVQSGNIETTPGKDVIPEI